VGENEQVTAMGETVNRAKSCRWCRLVEAGEHVVYRDPAYVVLEGPSRRRGGYVTFVTTAHASVITDLPSWQMGAILAGLTKASDRLRDATGASNVEVRAHPTGGRGARGHLHFRLMPDSPAAKKAAQQAFDYPSAFASLAESISH
jgi:diadenosine tetraphosphate (Ap4A) HIT family hydrolase